MSLCININLSMDIEETKEKMLAINNAKQKLRDAVSNEVGVIQAQFSELKKDRLDNGYHFDVGSLKMAIINKMGVDPSLLKPVEGWDSNEGLANLFGFFSGDSYETKRAKLDTLERDHKIIVNYRDEHEQTYSKHIIITKFAAIADSLANMFDQSIGSLVSTYLTTLIVADVVRSSDKHTRYHLEFFVMTDTDMVKFYFLDIAVERIMSQGWFTLLRGEQELVKIRILNMIGLTKKL